MTKFMVFSDGENDLVMLDSQFTSIRRDKNIQHDMRAARLEASMRERLVLYALNKKYGGLWRTVNLGNTNTPKKDKYDWDVIKAHKYEYTNGSKMLVEHCTRYIGNKEDFSIRFYINDKPQGFIDISRMF